MATIIERYDPSTPSDAVKHRCEGGMTIREWLRARFPGFKEFTTPVVCILIEGVKERALLRKEWDRKIKPNDVVIFEGVLGDAPDLSFDSFLDNWHFPFTFVWQGIKGIGNLIPSPPKVSSAQSQTVHTLSGQGNAVKLGQPIEVPYGRNRLWPSYAARPYNRFIDDDQWLFAVYVLGQGEYDIEEIKFGDADIETLDDIETEVIAPGNTISLFADNVFVSENVSSVKLPEWGENTFVGPFTTNPAGSTITKIEVDIVWPKGQWRRDGGSGDLTDWNISFEFEAREIDDNGDAIGSWVKIIDVSRIGDQFVREEPFRKTYEASVTSGRYEVRGRRLDANGSGSRWGGTTNWTQLRGFGDNSEEYGNVTAIALKAKAGVAVNDRSQNKLNVVATRKIPVWDSGTETWSSPQINRNPVWAFTDIFRASYGAGLDDQYIDLEELSSLADTYDTAGVKFDFVFDQATNIWEAARTVARAGRAEATVRGSKVLMIRDEADEVPVMAFGPDNMIAGSFTWGFSFPQLREEDGMIVQYEDENTWLEEEVDASLDADAGNNPGTLQLEGVKQRDQALRLGLYWRARNRYERQSIEFTTGKQGLFLEYRDPIQISFDIPRWGTSGLVESIDGTTLKLKDPVDFESGETYEIRITGPDGSHQGPFEVEEGSSRYEVELTGSGVSIELPPDDGKSEKAVFLFGKTENVGKLCKVMEVSPVEGEGVTVRAIVYRSEPFDHDAATAPALVEGTMPEDEEDPAEIVINSVDIIPPFPGSGSWPRMVQIMWTVSGPARSFVLQVAASDTESATPVWSDSISIEGGKSKHFYFVDPGFFRARIAAVTENGRGPWTEGSVWIVSVGIPEIYEKFDVEIGKAVDPSGSADTVFLNPLDVNFGEAINDPSFDNQFDYVDEAFGEFIATGVYEPSES